MRGKTVKKLRKFVKIVVENSQNAENPRVLLRRMKREWQRGGKVGRDFVDAVISGNLG